MKAYKEKKSKAHLPARISANRFDTNPLITPASAPEIGTNIASPSVIKIPGWIDNPLGTYYLYFAHHPIAALLKPII